MEYAVEHTLKHDMEENKGVIVAYQVINGQRTNFREANAQELIEIVDGYREWEKLKEVIKGKLR